LERIEESAFSWTGLKSIEIPSSVVVLGKHCFERCESLETVAFERGSRLELINEFAFDGSGLTSIVIPSSIIVLSKWSFAGCKSLESVTFEADSRLERIEESAFIGSGLISIIIPRSVASISGFAFSTYCLSSISVSPDNRHFRIRESFLEDICGSTIYRYFGSCPSIAIPSYVVALSKGSFTGCKSLESVTFENGSELERIDEYAFSCPYTCYGGNLGTLKSIVIPASVVVLGKDCFGHCKSLESVRFDSCGRLELIDEASFYESGLRSIEIPSSVVVLGKYSFEWCKSLESVTFENCSRLELIDESALSKTPMSFSDITDSLAASRSVRR
jgi:hypothetical protein